VEKDPSSEQVSSVKGGENWGQRKGKEKRTACEKDTEKSTRKPFEKQLR